MSKLIRLDQGSSSSASTYPPTEHVWLGNQMKWIFSLIALLLLNINFTQAQEHWSPFTINEGEGGQIINEIAVSKSDPNFLMFGTDVGGVFRSTDGGANWIAAGRDLTSITCLTLQIDPNNSNRVLMVGSSPWSSSGQQNGIWLSTDKGVSFSQVLRDDNNAKNGMYERLGEQLVIDGSSYDAGKGYCMRMYCASATGTFYTSTDGGVTWATSTALTTNAYSLAINNGTGDIFAWFQTQLFRSTDKGASFQLIYTGTDWVGHVRNVGSKTYMVTHHGSVFVSTDNGNNFTVKGNNGWPANNSGSYIDRFEVSPANTNNMTLLVNMGDRYYSQDGGDNWAKCDFSNLGHSVIDGIAGLPSRAFAWHPTDGNVAWDTRHDFVTKSSDGGKSYKWSNKGYAGIFMGQANSFHFNSQNSDYLSLPSCDWNGAVTYDAGKTWNTMTTYQWWGWNFAPYAVSPGVWFYAAAENNAFYKPVLKVTRDYGQTYESYPLGQGWLPTASSYMDPTDANVWFYCGYRSTDAGHTWNGTDQGVVVLTHDNKTNALYGYSWESSPAGWAVFKSTDKGATFQKVFHAGGGDLRDIAIDNINNFIYACHDTYVEKYNVATGTFVTLGTFPTDQYGSGPNTRSVAVDPVDPKIVYVANGGHFYAPDNSVLRSRDGGATWESLTPSNRNNNLKYAADNGGKGAVDALWIRVNPKTREAIVGTNDFGFWKIGAPGSTTTPPPPPTSYAINAGGGATGTFAADNYVSGGNTYTGTSTIDVSGVTNAAPAAIYQSERWGPSTYTFPSLVSGQSYTVRLHFAEIYFDAAGKRKFNVDINGTRQLTDFDIFAAAGAKNKALVKEFTITPNSSSNIVIAFTNGALDNAKINGIEVFPSSVVTPPAGFSGYYKLTAKHSGKVLDVSGSSTADGAVVQQFTSNGGDAQKWLIEDVGGGYYSLKARCSGKALDVTGGPTATANGVQIQQWTYGGGDNQKWKIESVESGYYKLTAKHSGKCLDINGGVGATGDGALAHQWDYLGADNQKWALTYISATGAREASANGKKVENTEPALTNFNVYPNPASGIANVSYTANHTEQIAIHLYDTQGRLVKTIFTGTALKGVAQNYTIDGSSLREGLYIIKLKTSSETINKKLIFDK